MLLPLLLFCISTSITPGPNNFMLMVSATNFGIRRSLPHFMGICLGFPVMVLIIGLGLASVFSAYPLLYNVIKYVGMVYMMYLTYKIITSVTNTNINGSTQPISFIQAVLFQWVNPKAWIMAVAAVSTYTTKADNLFYQVLLISFIFLVTLFPSSGIWLLGGSIIQKLVKNQRQLRIFNLVMGAALLASITFMFI